MLYSYYFNEEISSSSSIWCLGGITGGRCTPAEALGIWMVIVFYSTVILTTIIHVVLQNLNGNDDEVVVRHYYEASSPTSIRRHFAGTTRTNNNNNNNARTTGGGDHQEDDYRMVFFVLIYFFGFVIGCLVWAITGAKGVHPIQIWPIQLFGSVLLIACTFGFLAVHINLGKNWSPQPSRKANNNHELVTHGMFRWARHPMYSIFLWAFVGTTLATLNWVIAWCVFGSVVVTLQRIPTEEQILLDLFGDEYRLYRQRVSALGPPWGYCLGFDQEEIRPESTSRQRNYNDYQSI